MRSLIKAFTPKPFRQILRNIRQRWFTNYAQDSFAQEGEDLVLERFLEGREKGFYVDIGAHHPMRFSNTYRLYRRGWRGLNVDASPGSMSLFRRLRPRDINVEAGISAESAELKFYVFNDPALNTFDKQLADERVGTVYSIVDEVNLPVRPLWELLDQYVPQETSIDLLTVDVEGLDYEILRSNDWNRYVPQFVLVECLGSLTLDQAVQDPIGKLLSDNHYSIVAKTMNTALYKRIL